MADSEVEVLEVGPRRRAGRRGPLLVGILVVVVGVVLAIALRPGSSATDGSTGDLNPPSPGTLHPGPSQPRAPASSEIGQPPAVLHLLAPRIDGFRSGSLVVRSSELVYRIRLSDGRIVATPAALTGDDAHGSVLAGRDATVLRSPDDQTVLIPNDRPATLQAGAMQDADLVLPGADGTFWIRTVESEDAVVMTRVRSDGSQAGEQVSSLGIFLPDGRGNLLLLDQGGIWDLRREGQHVQRWHKLTTGELTATGRDYLLFTECDSFSRCGLIRYDRATGQRSTASRTSERLAAGGSVSADGRYVTEIALRRAVPVVQVVDLRTGRAVAAIPVDERLPDLSNVAVWSRTGHRLLVISNGDLVTVDPPSGRVRPVGLGLGALRQLSLPTD